MAERTDALCDGLFNDNAFVLSPRFRYTPSVGVGVLFVYAFICLVLCLCARVLVLNVLVLKFLKLDFVFLANIFSLDYLFFFTGGCFVRCV